MTTALWVIAVMLFLIFVAAGSIAERLGGIEESVRKFTDALDSPEESLDLPKWVPPHPYQGGEND
jgi:hypothetical protein